MLLATSGDGAELAAVVVGKTTPNLSEAIRTRRLTNVHALYTHKSRGAHKPTVRAELDSGLLTSPQATGALEEQPQAKRQPAVTT